MYAEKHEVNDQLLELGRECGGYIEAWFPYFNHYLKFTAIIITRGRNPRNVFLEGAKPVLNLRIFFKVCHVCLQLMVAIRHKLFSTIMDKNRGSNLHLWVFLKLITSPCPQPISTVVRLNPEICARKGSLFHYLKFETLPIPIHY